MIGFGTALLLSLPLLGAGGGDVSARLAEAQQLAGRQESSAAVDAYRALIGDGVDGAHIRYNLGTLLLEQGDLGGAVRELLAARRQDPLDDDVAHNLAVAMELRTDRLAGVGTVNPIFFIGERMPPGAARRGAGLVLATFGLALSLLAWRRRAVLMAVVATTAFASMISLVLLACRLEVERTVEAVVLAESTSAKKEPDGAAAESFVAHAGLAGMVVDDQGTWVRLRLDNGLDAWFERATLGFVGPSASAVTSARP